MSTLQKKFLISVGVIAILGFIFYRVYGLGNQAGKNATEVEWAKEREATNNRIMDLMAANAVKEQAHRARVTEIADELEKTHAQFNADIAAMRDDYDKRLRESNTRAALYERMSKAGPAQQERLAGYAAKLDGSLEAGRHLVKEFRATLEQRDRELKLLGAQIIADRNLVGENNEPSAK